jgi:hypothetical protein
LPLIVMLRSVGGLMSSTTSMPVSMVTASPSAGTRPLGQVAGSDQSASEAALAAELASRQQAGNANPSKRALRDSFIVSTPLTISSPPGSCRAGLRQ